MDSFKKQIENLESTDIVDIDMNVFKNEFRKILSGDFSKVFGSKFVENLILEVELVLSLSNDFIFSESYNNKGNETKFVNDILSFYLESLENSDNPTNKVLEGNTITIRSEDLKYTEAYTKGNIDNVLLDKKTKSDNQSYKETLNRIKSKSSKELINAFKKLTKLKSITGSHHIFNNKESSSSFPVPLSKGTLPIGTLNSIIRFSIIVKSVWLK